MGAAPEIFTRATEWQRLAHPYLNGDGDPPPTVKMKIPKLA